MNMVNIPRYIGCVLLAVGAISAKPAVAPAQDAPAAERTHGGIGLRLDNYMKRAEALGFSGQVLVARGGEVLLHRAYGFSDRHARLAMTTETAVGVASMSKQFTAAAVLKLESQGRLRLTDSLSAWFRDVPADKRAITIQQLLVHTSGIRGGTTDDFDVGTLDESIARLMSLPLTGEPGKTWRYSSDAYGIIAAIVQRASGMPYERYMHDSIFSPAGMARTGFWNEAKSLAPVARAYAGLRDRGSPEEWPRNWRVFGSGDVLTTAGDLYRWDRALRGGKVLSPAALAKYATPQVPTGDGVERYGYGLFIYQTPRGTRVIEHGGDTELGYNGAFFRYVDEDAVLIVTSNARDPFGRSMRQYVQEDLVKMMFGGDSVAALPSLTAASASQQLALAGTYRLGRSGELHLISNGQSLWIAAEGQDAVDLIRPVSATISATALAATNRKTDALVGLLLAHDTTAYMSALGDSGLVHIKEYRDEWDTLLRRMGPLNSYKVLGSIPDRATSMTFVRLSFFRGNLTMVFRWADGGTGRLVATNPDTPAAFPVTIPVAFDGAGRLVAYDSWRAQPRAVIEVGPRLRVQRVEGGAQTGQIVTTDLISRTEWSPRR